jgi:CheY-like chemotaxis protein
VKILVVDDLREMRKIIIEMLHEPGKEFFEAEDGKDAVKIYSSLLPDWVLMDVQMKHMNGFEASRQIKKDHPDAHIVIVSVYDDEYYRKYAKEIGVDAFVSKHNLLELKNLFK